MYFESLAAALAMDGHGPYVWAAYGLTLTVIAVLVASPLIRKRRLLRELRGEYRRSQQSEASSNVELS
ncbi:heme exporter protein CcmD [Congregibacter sp.]|uniref:heme exporter protein CcmD n=1 Tax=Congregibacter sp. TaxID=2744308 RepID=UPI003F6BC3F1